MPGPISIKQLNHGMQRALQELERVADPKGNIPVASIGDPRLRGLLEQAQKAVRTERLEDIADPNLRKLAEQARYQPEARGVWSALKRLFAQDSFEAKSVTVSSMHTLAWLVGQEAYNADAAGKKDGLLSPSEQAGLSPSGGAMLGWAAEVERREGPVPPTPVELAEAGAQKAIGRLSRIGDGHSPLRLQDVQGDAVLERAVLRAAGSLLARNAPRLGDGEILGSTPRAREALSPGGRFADGVPRDEVKDSITRFIAWLPMMMNDPELGLSAGDQEWVEAMQRLAADG